ncbi:MAG: VTT domain-containing protein, partial [Gemmatimonadota bacterium]|nr:VTT domain-containing protein [Gemmatimonadota bacterium]
MTSGQAARKRGAIIRGALLLVALAVGAIIAAQAGWFRGVTPERVALLRDRLRATPGAPLVFVALYVVASAFALPGTLLTLAGGAIFGTVLGTLLNWIGATMGATASFAIARWFGRD